MASTVNIRTSIDAGNTATKLMNGINKIRKKEKKELISKSQIIALAIENFTVELADAALKAREIN